MTLAAALGPCMLAWASLCFDGALAPQADDPQHIQERHVRNLLDDLQDCYPGPAYVSCAAERELIRRRWICVDACNWLQSMHQAEFRGGQSVMFVLGAIKDPSTIETIETCWQRESGLARAWLMGWRTQLPYFAAHPDEWLAIQEAWLASFSRLLSRSSDPVVRLRATSAFDRWFFHPEAVPVLLKAVEHADSANEFRFRIEGLLWRRGALRPQEFSKAYATAVDSGSNSFVLALEFPARELVPQLAEYVDKDGISVLLKHLTFGPEPAEGWAEWAANHKDESPQQWFSERAADVLSAAESGKWAIVRDFTSDHMIKNDLVVLRALAPHVSDVDGARALLPILRPSLDPRVRAVTQPLLKRLREAATRDPALRSELREALLWQESWCESAETIPQQLSQFIPRPHY